MHVGVVVAVVWHELSVIIIVKKEITEKPSRKWKVYLIDAALYNLILVWDIWNRLRKIVFESENLAIFLVVKENGLNRGRLVSICAVVSLFYFNLRCFVSFQNQCWKSDSTLEGLGYIMTDQKGRLYDCTILSLNLIASFRFRKDSNRY